MCDWAVGCGSQAQYSPALCGLPSLGDSSLCSYVIVSMLHWSCIWVCRWNASNEAGGSDYTAIVLVHI